MNYIIGDVHNNIRELEKLINLLKPNKKDTLIFLGDLIDKNPYTSETLGYLNGLKSKLIFIKGNHEFVWEEYLIENKLNRKEFLINYGGRESLSKIEGGTKALESNDLEKIKRMLSQYLKIIGKMVPYYLISNYIVIHGGLLPSQLNEKNLKIKEINYFLRQEKINKTKKYLNKYRIIAGHTPMDTIPFFSEGYINIDTGAGSGNYLSAYHIEKKEVIRSDGKKFQDK